MFIYSRTEYIKFKRTTSMQKTIILATLLAMIILSGCSSVSSPTSQGTLPPIEENSTVSDAQSAPADPTSNQESTVEPTPNAASNNAALLLLAQSETLRNEGKGKQAIAMVERAIRLEPSNGDLWVQLGRLNYETNEYARAEQYARRGISLTQAGSDTLKQGWLLLADVSEARGDIEGAKQIRSRWLNSQG